MHGFLLVAGALAGLTTFVHVVIGGREVARPLLDAGLAEDVRLTAYACWHAVSVALMLSTGVFLAMGLGLRPSRETALVLGALWVLFSGVFLYLCLVLARPRGLFRYPQWVLLLPVGVSAVVGGLRLAE